MSDSVRPHRRQPTRLPCPWDSPGKNTGVGCRFMKVKSQSEVARSCLTLSYPMDYSPPGSCVLGIFQARVLESGAIGFCMDMYTLLHLKQVTNRDLLYSTWNSAQRYVTGWIGGEFGGEGMHVHVWLSLFTIHLKLSQHCLLIDYTPIQNKNFKKKMFLKNFYPRCH